MTNHVNIPGYTQVIAIKGYDTGGDKGIIASLDNGMVTDSSWKCTATAETGWNEAWFDDSFWPAATVVGSNGGEPWGSKTKNISCNAKWIWSANNGDTVYCRTNITKGLFKYIKD